MFSADSHFHTRQISLRPLQFFGRLRVRYGGMHSVLVLVQAVVEAGGWWLLLLLVVVVVVWNFLFG